MIYMNESKIQISDAQIIAYAGKYHLSPIYQSISNPEIILCDSTYEKNGYFHGQEINQALLEQYIYLYGDIQKLNTPIKAESDYELLKFDDARVYYLNSDDADKTCKKFAILKLILELSKQGIDSFYWGQNYGLYDFSRKINLSPLTHVQSIFSSIILDIFRLMWYEKFIPKSHRLIEIVQEDIENVGKYYCDLNHELNIFRIFYQRLEKETRKQFVFKIEEHWPGFKISKEIIMKQIHEMINSEI